MTAQEIYDTIKEGDNKKIWAFAQELASFKKQSSKVKPKTNIDFTNHEEVQKYVIESLLAQAAKELSRMFQIGDKGQDLIIQCVDFKDAYNEDNTTSSTKTKVLPIKQLESNGPGGKESSNIVAS
jgi:hypothetical protein